MVTFTAPPGATVVGLTLIVIAGKGSGEEYGTGIAEFPNTGVLITIKAKAEVMEMMLRRDDMIPPECGSLT